MFYSWLMYLTFINFSSQHIIRLINAKHYVVSKDNQLAYKQYSHGLGLQGEGDITESTSPEPVTELEKEPTIDSVDHLSSIDDKQSSDDSPSKPVKPIVTEFRLLLIFIALITFLLTTITVGILTVIVFDHRRNP